MCILHCHANNVLTATRGVDQACESANTESEMEKNGNPARRTQAHFLNQHALISTGIVSCRWSRDALRCFAGNSKNIGDRAAGTPFAQQVYVLDFSASSGAEIQSHFSFRSMLHAHIISDESWRMLHGTSRVQRRLAARKARGTRKNITPIRSLPV